MRKSMNWNICIILVSVWLHLWYAFTNSNLVESCSIEERKDKWITSFNLVLMQIGSHCKNS